MGGYRSVVQHLTTDQDVAGSDVPSTIISGMLKYYDTGHIIFFLFFGHFRFGMTQHSSSAHLSCIPT